MSLANLHLAALAALLPVLVAYADTPFRTFGQKFVVHRWAERLVLFSMELNLLLLWALAKLFLGRDLPLSPAAHFDVPLAVAGVLVAWLGAALAVWAKLTLGRWFSASFGVKPEHELVTTGPYAIVRHPMYTALVLLGIGLGVAFDSVLTVAMALLFLVPFLLHTYIEEQIFVQHFGDAWRDYAARVPRLVPGWRGRR